MWITGGDAAARRLAVAAWADLHAAVRPDFASVNLSEPDWPGICRILASAWRLRPESGQRPTQTNSRPLGNPSIGCGSW